MREGDRSLKLSRTRNTIAFELNLGDGFGGSLVHALLELSDDTSQPPSAKSIRSKSDTSFYKRETQYLDAMLAWAQRV